MTQPTRRNIKSMLEEANAEIETMKVADVIAVAGQEDVVIVDLRDPRELEREGKIPGAFSCTRGMLEFWIDPESPYAKEVFQQDKKFVFYCASGWRSALATKTAQDMGLLRVAHIEGGFSAWRNAGGPVEKVEPRKPKT
ncbi:MAG: rhodanese-like domain-containing protein [Rhizobiales bacterium]|jgi:rhodanese-related sulfurtransferase|nr:rhodanese-like domain-containing protein [Hyphomicrobiales bacterium]